MRWLVFLTLGLLSFALPLQASAAEVRVCIYDNPPLNYTDSSGQALGLLPDLLTAVAAEHGWTLRYLSGDWNHCLSQLTAGEVDLLPVIAYSDQRAQQFRFAKESVVTNWGQVYLRSGENLDSILQLAGRKVAVLKNDIYYRGENGIDQVAKNFAVKLEFVEVPSYLDSFKLLSAGEVDAALVNRLFGMKQQGRFNLRPSAVMLNPIKVRPAFSQVSDPALSNQFDQSLARWKQDPDSIYFQALDDWIGEEEQTQLPGWVKMLLHILAGLLGVLLLAAVWCRRQVGRQTRQLEEQNRRLEDELLERQQVEQELRERQQQYQVLFEDSHTVMLLVDPLTAAIVDANPAACSFYQYSRQQIQGMPISRLNEMPEVELRKRISQVERREQQRFQFQHRLADGQLRDVEVHSSPIVVEGRSLFCSIIHDITERKQVEQQLEARHDFLQTVIDGVSDPLMVIATDHKVIQLNRAARAQLPENLKQRDDLTCHMASHASQVPCDGEAHPCPLVKVQETGEPVTLIHRHTSNRGQRIIELKASPLFHPDGSIKAVIEVARDITERLQIEELLSENEKRLHHLAHHDSLTDLPNRLLFEDRLKQALSKARRSGRQVALFFLDLDHFKDVNDNLGHDYGDLLLVDIANRLNSCVRESDTVARMGGDEFLVLLDEVESLEMVEAMAARVSKALVHELTRDHYYQRVSASIGISIFPDDGSTGQELLKNADLAMYRAKNLGKNTYQFYSTYQTGFLFDA